ncbi:MAG: YceI family protein [Bacteroidota bacterium]
MTTTRRFFSAFSMAFAGFFLLMAFRPAPIQSPASTDVQPGTYAMDLSHSQVEFKVRHLGISTVKGRFTQAESTVTFGSAALSSMQVTATIDASSIFTGNDQRDEHLRSADFFEVETYPTITFESTGVSGAEDSEFQLMGNLTMHGVTQPVTMDVEFLGTATDPWGNTKVGFEAEAEINRKDFGLTWNQALEAGGLLVAETVTITLDVQAAKQ